ncbi:hypothetical protein BBK36DRAFT_1167061 [Trichoderma citrinoviride]|uniref:Uncharacterized protein n=1 Tax=Trichoderma citrinoviride TaxID=58853 RepID=A0A2T4BIV2_9HYPO|nr:hypothetical protein BBK36DRAFT_1167061 [Trichoderma citrinoviride]PTB69201.1 hypothetical protein BBK36DRAFT_1167061 [Trichoderma citrinoviride]
MSNRSLSGQTDEDPRINIRISSSPPINIPFHTRQRPRQYQTFVYEPPQHQDGPLNVPFLLEPFETEPQTEYQANRSMMQLESSPSIVTSMPTASLFAQTAPMHDLGDVVQFNQERANASQRRNEASPIHVLNPSFGWNGNVLTSQGLPLARHRDFNISSMDIYPETFSVDTRLTNDQWSDDLGEPWQANGYQGSTHDFLDPDQDFSNPQSGYSGHIVDLAPGPREHGRIGSADNQRAQVVEAGVEQMVKNLDSLYRRISMGLDVTGAHDAQRSFMCPYAMRYPDRVSHNCFQKLNSIPYVKQHLRHNHHDAISCPHRCQNRRPGARPSRSRPSAGLSFGADMCLQINKQRSDRSRTHKQQWERIYQILFPGADRVSDPYIADSTVKRLRHFFKFMENHGIECLAAVYAQLPDTVSYPEPEIMYRRAFCTWLPRIFESRFPPQGHLLLGDFLSQIDTFLRDDSFLMDSSSGAASLRSAASLPDVRQMGQPDPSFTAMSQMGSLSSQQQSYSAIPSPYLTHQQSSFEPMEGASFLESSFAPTPSEMSYFETPIPLQTDIDSATPLFDEANLANLFDGHNFSFDQYGPMQGSPSQFFEDADGILSGDF